MTPPETESCRVLDPADEDELPDQACAANPFCWSRSTRCTRRRGLPVHGRALSRGVPGLPAQEHPPRGGLWG